MMKSRQVGIVEEIPEGCGLRQLWRKPSRKRQSGEPGTGHGPVAAGPIALHQNHFSRPSMIASTEIPSASAR